MKKILMLSMVLLFTLVTIISCTKDENFTNLKTCTFLGCNFLRMENSDLCLKHFILTKSPTSTPKPITSSCPNVDCKGYLKVGNTITECNNRTTNCNGICNLTHTTPPNSVSGNGGSNCSSVQCSGTTQQGVRCKNKTTNCSGRCYLHG